MCVCHYVSSIVVVMICGIATATPAPATTAGFPKTDFLKKAHNDAHLLAQTTPIRSHPPLSNGKARLKFALHQKGVLL